METSANTLPITVANADPNFGSCTYFRTSDVTPFIDDNGLNIYNGHGKSRSWGRPTVKSTVQVLTADVIEVQVTGWHKHTVSPVGGSYYFVRQADGTWVRKTANAKVVKAALSIRQ